MSLCASHRRERDGWLDSVHSLAAHPTMRPLDNGRYAGPTSGRRAAAVVSRQIGLIREWCAEGKGCG